jgi:hypothetical protein
VDKLEILGKREAEHGHHSHQVVIRVVYPSHGIFSYSVSSLDSRTHVANTSGRSR